MHIFRLNFSRNLTSNEIDSTNASRQPFHPSMNSELVNRKQFQTTVTQFRYRFNWFSQFFVIYVLTKVSVVVHATARVRRP